MTVQHLDRRQLRRIANAADVRPSSSWGQHFLHDATTARRIVTASGVRRHDHVLDIGAGLGSLTLALLDKGAHVTAVEIDPRLARELPTIVADHTLSEIHRLTVINGDVMALHPSDLADQPTAVVVNVPNTIDVVMHLLAEFPSIRTVLAVLESVETAQRLTAEPGTSKYSADGAKIRFFGTVGHRGVIEPTAWWPAPRTHYSLVRLDRYQAQAWNQDSGSRASVFRLIDDAFAQRRNSSRSAFADWAGSGRESARRLLAASIDPARRPDDLGIIDFVRLHQRSATADAPRPAARSSAVA
jgi:16S rRNA (adenine1518-N6/adenine1519-N6)-dimethyltransferase